MIDEDIHAWDTGDDDSPALDLKMEEWAEREWATWLEENLTFPFRAKREHDEADALFTDAADPEPFGQGQEMSVVGLEPGEDQEDAADGGDKATRDHQGGQVDSHGKASLANVRGVSATPRWRQP